MADCFVWVPAHQVVECNEDSDILAKQSLQLKSVNSEVLLRNAEGDANIREQNLGDLYT